MSTDAIVLLKDPEWREWNDTEIARQCGLSDKTVAKLRWKLLSSDDPTMSPSSDGPRMRKVSSPLGETLRWPSGSSGAVPTKNMCCRPMNPDSLSSIRS